MSTEQLLDIEPPVPSFPFELRRVRRQVSCTILLSNKTQFHIAFMVEIPNSQNYGCEPNRGILLPWSTCDLTVTMQALEEAPRNMKCENKFLIRSLVVSSGATREDVEILFDEEGHRSQNGLLNAEYIFPRQVQSVVPDGIFDEEGHRSQNSLLNAEYIFPRQVQSVVPDGFFDEEGHRSQNSLLNAEYIFPRQVQSVVPDGIEGHRSQNSLLNAEYIFPRQVQSVVPDGIFDEEGHRSQNGLLNAEYIFPRQVQSVVAEGIVAWITIAMLAIIFWFPVKKTLLVIRSSIILLTIKIISQSVSDAIKDWILDTLRDIFFNPLYRRFQDIVHGFERNDRDIDRA